METTDGKLPWNGGIDGGVEVEGGVIVSCEKPGTGFDKRDVAMGLLMCVVEGDEAVVELSNFLAIRSRTFLFSSRSWCM